MTALAQLQALHARYTDMLALAVANDWDALAALAAETTHQRAALERAGSLLAQATAESAPELRETIEAILELDQRIREHTVPCLESTRQLLTGAVRNSNVQKAYGALGP